MARTASGSWPRTVGVFFVLAASLPTLSAADGATDTPPTFGEDSHRVFFEEIRWAHDRQYAAVLQAYDAHLRSEPEDVTAAIEKCLFIEEFAYSEDFFIESVSADHEICLQMLRDAPLGSRPESLLYVFERKWGDDAIAEGEGLLAQAGSWPPEQRSRVHGHLSTLYQATDAAKAGSHAVAAVQLDPASPARLAAARWLLQIGAKDRASNMIKAAPAWSDFSVYEAAQLLVDLHDGEGAVALLDGADSDEENHYLQFLLARALWHAGEVASARRIYDDVVERANLAWAQRGLRDHFAFEREHGSNGQAQAAYKRLRDLGYEADAFGYHRLSLVYKNPAAPWAWRDALGVLALFAVLCAHALLPALVIVPVHHRGLVRRLSGTSPESPPLPWQLRHAWYGLAALLVISTFMLYAFAYPAFESAYGWFGVEEVMADDGALARMLIWQTAVLALFAVPLLRGVDLFQFLKGKWSWTRSLLAGIGCALLARIAIAWWASAGGSDSPGALGSDTTRALQGIHSEFGLWPLLLVAGIAVPVLEEFLFRGVLLGALRRHVSFWTAASLQALLFAAIHEDWQVLPLFFGFGMLAAWLHRRSEGLFAPIAMHATFNILAVFGLVLLTNAIESTP